MNSEMLELARRVAACFSRDTEAARLAELVLTERGALRDTFCKLDERVTALEGQLPNLRAELAEAIGLLRVHHAVVKREHPNDPCVVMADALLARYPKGAR